MLLENLIGIKSNPSDLPDAGGWELKYSGGTALLTMFHLSPQPRGVIKEFLQIHGWKGRDGRINFRHTIAGKSSRGFWIEDKDGKLHVSHKKGPECYWTHDSIINSASTKFRRLLLVTGKKKDGQVTFEAARALDEFSITKFIPASLEGLIKVEFDARCNNGKRDSQSVRDHGTKFRIKASDIPSLYERDSSI